MFRRIIFAVIVLFSLRTDAALRIIYESSLDRESGVFGQVNNRNGVFLAGRGWQATNVGSQLMITLPQSLGREGALLVDLTNFDPVQQNADIKQQIINLYSQANGSKAIFETQGSWINIRTGTGYTTGPDVAGFKMLAASCGIGTRDEVRIMEDATWSLAKKYEFKITWDALSTSCYLNGQKCWTLPFKGQVEMFRYIFLGTDNVYSAQPGVIYSNLRIMGLDDTTLTEPSPAVLPASEQLYQNYPNPFNPSTRIAFDLARQQRVTMDIYDVLGQRVAQLVDETLPPGPHEVMWGGNNDEGAAVPAGVYFYRMQAGSSVQMRRMIFIK